MAGQEACQAGTERTRPFDRERTPTRRAFSDELQRLRVAAAVCRDGRLEHNDTTDNLDDSERVKVAVRVDTNDVVQLICKHPFTDLQPKCWGTRTGAGLGMEPRAAEL